MQVSIMQMLEQRAETDKVAAETLTQIREIEAAYYESHGCSTD